MQKFHTKNTLLGWLVCCIAITIYVLTIEPTASFWDCSEYIATAYKLQVPHPPGAPFFLLLCRLFSFLAGGDVTQVAYWMNIGAALASGITVMMVFRIISILARLLLSTSADTLSKLQVYCIWSASIVGAFSVAFSDTFWFTATETETYAPATCIMITVVWAMLNWSMINDQQKGYRWLLLILYLIGISIGLRIFSVLTLPALGLLFYFKKYKYTTYRGIFTTLLLSGGMIGFIYVGIMSGLPTLALHFDIFFVNILGLAFGSGAITLMVLLCASLCYLLIYTYKKQKPTWHTALLGLVFILIGYSSYTLVLIRSSSNPPINENNPSNLINFISYLNREQYGDRALLYGPYFNAKVIQQKKGAAIYSKEKNTYEVSSHKLKTIFDPLAYTILPRIWSRNPHHIQAYQSILQLKKNQQPHFGHNLQFLFKHQLGHFYFRYFLWNFSGRESDWQNARWLSPIDAFKKTPPQLANNRARHQYYMLPLLLGLLGMLLQYKRDRRNFGVLITLFLMLGVALVLFLNPPPIEPRERDYIYVGSFVIFGIWIGLGTIAVIDYFRKYIQSTWAVILGFVLCSTIPIYMLKTGWSSHNRSERYFSVDASKNLLTSCAPNAILFTAGDNDTFPLWYLQEVEGFRTDVRVVVLTYFNTDWYIDQMKRTVYQSQPLSFSLQKENYKQGGLNDILFCIEKPGIKGAIDLRQYLQLIKNNYPELQVETPLGYTNIMPAKYIMLTDNKQDLVATKTLTKTIKKEVVDTVYWSIKGNLLEKKDLMILDFIAANRWKRPIYFDQSALQSIHIDLQGHVVEEGLALRLLPIQQQKEEATIHTERMYHNLMHQFHWRGLNNPSIYYDENYRNFVLNSRAAFNKLAHTLLKEQQIDKTKLTLLRSLYLMPDKAIPYDIANAQMVLMLFAVDEKEKALNIAKKMGDRAKAVLNFYQKSPQSSSSAVYQSITILHVLSQALKEIGETAMAQDYLQYLHQYRPIMPHN